MIQADLEALVLQSTDQAKLMTEWARKGVEHLALVEQTANDAAQKLETDVAHTRSVLTATTQALDNLQLELDKRDGELHQALKDLEQGSVDVEKQIAAAVDHLRTAHADLTTRADDSLKHVKGKMATCQKELDDTLRQAQRELTQLRTYTTNVATLVTELKTAADTLDASIKTALTHLLDEHKELDKAINTQLSALETAYNQAITDTENRLTILEGEVDQLIRSTDQHLDEALVKKLGAELRKAADGFAKDLAAMEKEMSKVQTNLTKAHRGFRDNMTKAVEPGIEKTAQGLFDAARNLNWV